MPVARRFFRPLAGRLCQGFFVRCGRPADADGLPTQSETAIEDLMRFSAEFENEIVGPPLTREAAGGRDVTA